MYNYLHYADMDIMKTRIVALLMAFICLSLVTCSFAATPGTHKIKTVEKTIKVNSNSSTGYYWDCSVQ